jgi:DnaK suppressor protein
MLLTNDAARRERHETLKGMLEERRQEIVSKLRSIRETMPDQRLDVQDAEEQAVTDFAKDMEFALVQMKADTLGLIDEALRRLEAGTYGECAECGTDIPSARLKALPFALLCVNCQEQVETRTAEENKAVLRALPAL